MNDKRGLLYDLGGTLVPEINPAKGIGPMMNLNSARLGKLGYHLNADKFVLYQYVLGKQQGIVTTVPQMFMPWFYESPAINARAPIRENFDCVVAREFGKATKPSPIPYVEALERLRLEADECIAFENSLTGALAVKGVEKLTGKKLSLCIINEPLARRDREKLHEMADFDIDNFAELM